MRWWSTDLAIAFVANARYLNLLSAHFNRHSVAAHYTTSRSTDDVNTDRFPLPVFSTMSSLCHVTGSSNAS